MVPASKLRFPSASVGFAVLLAGAVVALPLAAAGEPVVFSAIGDVPYSPGELADLEQHVLDHNLYSPSSFLVHLGDILSSSESCTESRYRDVASTLLLSEVPVFIVPGDNEWVNCSNPNQGWSWWETHLLGLHEEFCFAPPVENQPARPENFAFVLKDVLFIGLNYVSGSPSPVTQASADWVAAQFAAHGGQVRAAVLMAQSEPGGSLRTAVEGNASAFGRPVLYIHGDGHEWLHQTNYLGHPNLVRIQVARGTSSNPPVQVTVTDAGRFEYDRDPWPAGTPPVAREGCSDESVLSIDDLFVEEGGTAVFTVSLAGATGAAVGVDYETEDDTARAGSDYSHASGRLSFSGSTTEREVRIPVLQDADPEPGEAFFVRLSNAAGGVIDKAQGAAVVLDDDVTPSQHSLGRAIQGLGSIALDPPGGLYEQGSIVRLTAVPASGYRFDGWSGAVSGRVNPTALVMDADRSVTAHFAPIAVGEHTLTVTTLGSGSVLLDPAGGAYAQGTVVALSPVPSPGWQFLGWSGDLGSFDAPALAMDADKAVTAIFAHASAPPAIPRSVPVAGDPDDAEERISTGAVTRTSSDLELGEDNGNPQVVGARFAGVPIPRGAVILGARLRFRVDETSPGPASLEIRAEASDHARPLSTASFDLSARPTTGAVVAWNPPAWTSVGATQSTPDLAALVGQVTSRPGWVAGNAIALVVRGTGRRTAESYGGSSAGAAVLDLVYRIAADLVPPGPPAGLGSPSQTLTSIELAWSAPQDPDVVGYRLKGPGGSVDLPGTHYVQTGLVPDTLYDFQVSALDAEGNESAPALLGVRTGAPDLVPPGTPQNLRSPAQTLTTIELAWDASTDDVGVVGYRLHGPDWKIDVAGTSQVVTGLEEDTPYDFQVIARDAAGNLSAPSPVLRVWTEAPDREPPSTPQGLDSPTQAATAIELVWDASTDNVGVTGYRVYGPNGSTDVVGTSHVETGLAPDTLYTFQVSAFDARANESQRGPLLGAWTRAAPASLALRVASHLDDSEERSTGSVTLTSSDLDLGEDGGSPQRVGLRFAQVPIPQGAAILAASVQFTADETRTGAASFLVHGEASGHAAPLSAASRNLSSRPTTQAAVAWAPGPWTLVGAAGAAQRTGGLSGILQEIVDRSDWSAGNAIVLSISGSGSRVAESHDGAAAAAPVLHVDYLYQPDREPPRAPPLPSSPGQTQTSIDLVWGAAIDDVGVTGYRVYGPNGTREVASTSYVETGLVPDTSYDFQITALDAAGHESSPSPALRVWTLPQRPSPRRERGR